MHLVAGSAQGLEQPVAAELQLVHVHGDVQQIGQRVLHHGIRRHVGGREARGHRSLTQRLTVGHRQRHRQVAQTLGRRERALAEGMHDERALVVVCRRPHHVPVEQDLAVRLVGQEVDGSCGTVRVPLQERGEQRERVVGIDPPGRIVRRIDQDHAGAGRQRRCDRVQIEVPRRLVRPHADRRRARAQDQRFVEEPRWTDEDDLISGIEHGRHRERHRAVRSAREEDVLGFESDAQLIAELRCGRLRGTRIRHPVREPPTILRLEPLLEGLDVAGERRDLRVACEEIAGVRVAHERGGSHDPAQEGRERGLDTHLPLGDRHASTVFEAPGYVYFVGESPVAGSTLHARWPSIRPSRSR